MRRNPKSDRNYPVLPYTVQFFHTFSAIKSLKVESESKN